MVKFVIFKPTIGWNEICALFSELFASSSSIKSVLRQKQPSKSITAHNVEMFILTLKAGHDNKVFLI